MSDPRNLGSIASSLFEGPGTVDWSWYVRIDFGSGTQRFTDRACNGSDTQNVGDGAGAVAWAEDRSMTITALEQAQDDPLQIQSISFGDLDNIWHGYALAPAGIRGVPIAIYAGWFNSAGVWQGALIMFEGYLDAGDFSDGAPATITLRPFLRSYLKQLPWRRFSKIDFPLVLAPGTVIAWGSKVGTAQSHSAVTSTSLHLPGDTTPRTRIIPAPPPAPPVQVHGR